ncbi:hypothetical protein J2S90_002506 [Arthrobacter bambusae]|uniref:Uncharacterized protein n=2 Tax=Arthrobacter bambusae TaxID=1338426 RepID=A0AAW8DGT4_9MICC|nr:hypothetical protein [Arthrobacter bambusae]MDQ0178725.1 hypothetical protein [Arthrobacter bambusae]
MMENKIALASSRGVEALIFDPYRCSGHPYPHRPLEVALMPGADGHGTFVDKTKTPLVTINAWNEWTEGSYFEPDTLHGTGHLEQIRDLFGSASSTELFGASAQSPAAVSF